VTSELSAYLFSVIETGGTTFDGYYKKGKAPKTRREAIKILQRAYNRPVTARELTDLMYELGKHQANVFQSFSLWKAKAWLKKQEAQRLLHIL
jgi:hypothetical protein